MNRLLDKLAYLAAVLAVLYAGKAYLQFPNQNENERPLVSYAEPELHAQSDKLSTNTPIVIIEVPEKQPSSGTAFAIGSGWWLTARHVADGCDDISLITAPGRAQRVEQVILHPGADLALLFLPIDKEPFTFFDEALRRGQDGFASGYPQGLPGDLYSHLIGRAQMKSVGRYRTTEPIVAWAEIQRQPGNLSALGGLSGGPMLNKYGEVIGVLVAASQRRGRVMTSDLDSINWLINQADLSLNTTATPNSLTVENFEDIGDDMRNQFRITKVICDVRHSSRRPRL